MNRRKHDSELARQLSRWKQINREIQEWDEQQKAGLPIDTEEYCALLEERKDAADNAVKALEAEMDTGHARIPDCEAMLEAMKEARANA